MVAPHYNNRRMPTAAPSNDAAQSSTGGTANVQPVEASVDSSVAIPRRLEHLTRETAGKWLLRVQPASIRSVSTSRAARSMRRGPRPTPTPKSREGNVAHGRYAMHLSNLHSHPQLFLHVAQMPASKTCSGAGFYLYMDPGAPVGHGAPVRAFDMQTNWYEVGFERNSYLGNWHVLPARRSREVHAQQVQHPQEGLGLRGVRFRRRHARHGQGLVRWTTPVMFDDIATTPTIMKTVQFTTFDIGIVFYHGTSLTAYEGDTAPSLTDMWLDDIALDTKRVGCL